MDTHQLKALLDEKVDLYNRTSFIDADPISIPHLFNKKQDIEITGLWAAVLAWGQRKTIINKCAELFGLMDHAPYDFILNHTESDLKRLESFKHRTFNATDTLYFVHYFNQYYKHHDSLEDAFLVDGVEPNVEKGLVHFHRQFFELPGHPIRTRKHIPTPERKSSL